MPISSVRVQAVHPDPADEPRTTRDLWVMSKDGTVQPHAALTDVEVGLG